MQKAVWVVLMGLCVPLSWGFDGVNGKALSALLKSDYNVKDFEDKVMPVSEALSPWFLSKFDGKGHGTLQTASQVCSKKANQYQCVLNLQSKDMQEKNDGSYRPADGSTESSVKVEYEVDLPLKKVLKAPRLFYAG